MNNLCRGPLDDVTNVCITNISDIKALRIVVIEKIIYFPHISLYKIDEPPNGAITNL